MIYCETYLEIPTHLVSPCIAEKNTETSRVEIYGRKSILLLTTLTLKNVLLYSLEMQFVGFDSSIEKSGSETGGAGGAMRTANDVILS